MPHAVCRSMLTENQALIDQCDARGNRCHSAVVSLNCTAWPSGPAAWTLLYPEIQRYHEHSRSPGQPSISTHRVSCSALPSATLIGVELRSAALALCTAHMALVRSMRHLVGPLLRPLACTQPAPACVRRYATDQEAAAAGTLSKKAQPEQQQTTSGRSEEEWTEVFTETGQPYYWCGGSVPDTDCYVCLLAVHSCMFPTHVIRYMR